MLDRFERFSFFLSELSRYWHRIAADEMAQYGLNGPHCVYLVTLRRHSQGLPAAQIAALCGKDKADVSRMMAVMVEKGLVERGPGGYRAPLKLTQSGMEAALHVEERAAMAVELGGEGLTDEERAVFYGAMERIVTNLRSLSEEGLPCGNNKE